MRTIPWLLLLGLAATAAHADFIRRDNNVRFGDGASSADKVLLFDLGLGTSNPRIRANKSTGAIEQATSGGSYQGIVFPPGSLAHTAAITDPSGWEDADGSPVSRTSQTYTALASAITIVITGSMTNGSHCISSPSSLTNILVGYPITDTASLLTAGTVDGLPGACSGGQIHVSTTAGSAITGGTFVIAPYGVATGAATIVKPDCRGRALFGTESTASRLTNAGSGDAGFVDILGGSGGSQFIASHTHGITDPGHVHSAYVTNAAGGVGGWFQGANSNTGAGSPPNTNSATTGISINAPNNVTTGSSGNVPPALAARCIVKL
jgi:hypothetical protein